METALLVIGIAVGVWLLLRLLLYWLANRTNEAGISTGMASRASQMGGLLTRNFRRRMYLRVRGLIATRERKKQLEHEYHLKSAEEAAEVMGNMKGVFMKLGQIVSFAKDTLPEPAQQALRGLQQDAPPMSFELARGVVEEELGADVGKFFKHVDEEPLAAASIGQVHRARLKDGTQVVLKIQYPGVDAAIENDLKFSGRLAAIINLVHKNADAKAIVAELKERLRDELDYRVELKNQQLFYDLWQGHPLIRIPKVYPEVSRKRVLCQEYKRGLSFYDFLEVANAREKQLAVMVLNDFVFDSMHIHHVFNGDPHPGNYIFHEDGGITFLDFGCVKHFEPGFIGKLQAMNRSIIAEDLEAFEALIRDLELVLPGRPLDIDFLWEFFAYHSAPFREDREFAFTQEWVQQAGEVMNPKDLQKLNLPPDLVFFNRITFGLNSIFQKLGASANWHRLYRRYLFEEENVPPALHHVGVELPERFLSAKQVIDPKPEPRPPATPGTDGGDASPPGAPPYQAAS